MKICMWDPHGAITFITKFVIIKGIVRYWILKEVSLCFLFIREEDCLPMKTASIEERPVSGISQAPHTSLSPTRPCPQWVLYQYHRKWLGEYNDLELTAYKGLYRRSKWMLRRMPFAPCMTLEMNDVSLNRANCPWDIAGVLMARRRQCHSQ